MALFISASDEAAGKNQREPFIFAGFVAPEDDWSKFFVPAWQERVLDGPPPIPHLHMTEIRSPGWRSEYGLSRLQAENRVEEAVSLIDAMGTLYPVCIRVDGGYFMDKLHNKKVAISGAIKPLAPDYVCFLLYAFEVLKHVERNHPEAEKVNFVIERNGPMTKHIQSFHSQMPPSLEANGGPRLRSLLGELIPGGKDRIPLQAADVLCWHTARPLSTMEDADVKRYRKFALRRGSCKDFTPEQMNQMDAAFSRHLGLPSV